MTTAPEFREQLFHESCEYHDREWCPLPIWFGDDGKSKLPTVKWKQFQTQRPSKAQLREWFVKRTSTCGVGVLLGNVSDNLAIRDYDDEAGYHDFRDTYPALAATLPTIRTKRGYGVLHRTDWVGFHEFPNGEYRADEKHMSVLPSSVRTIDGGSFRYSWVIPLPAGDIPLVPAALFVPQSALEKLEKPFSDSSNLSNTPGKIIPLSNFSNLSNADAVIHATQPTQPGQRNHCLLALARGVKFNLRLRDPATLRGIVREWFELALPVIDTKSFDITLGDFLHAFERARYPLGANPVDRAAAAPMPAIAQGYDSEPMQRLVTLCHELAGVNKGKFFLSSYDAANRIGVKQPQAWALLRVLESDGVIVCIGRGTNGPIGHRRATRYCWAASKGEE